eukprot:jgi/Galph1/3693/GphlegSOOS_G2315.1
MRPILQEYYETVVRPFLVNKIRPKEIGKIPRLYQCILKTGILPPGVPMANQMLAMEWVGQKDAQIIRKMLFLSLKGERMYEFLTQAVLFSALRKTPDNQVVIPDLYVFPQLKSHKNEVGSLAPVYVDLKVEGVYPELMLESLKLGPSHLKEFVPEQLRIQIAKARYKEERRKTSSTGQKK